MFFMGIFLENVLPSVRFGGCKIHPELREKLSLVGNYIRNDLWSGGVHKVQVLRRFRECVS